MIGINEVLFYLRSESSWSISNGDYASIQWHGLEAKPTEQEISDAWADAEIYWKRKEARLSKADFKLGLLEIGELDAVKQFIDNTNDERIIIMWEDSGSFRRTHPDLLRLAGEMGYTDEQLDELFEIN